jgi:hypothetical protein
MLPLLGFASSEDNVPSRVPSTEVCCTHLVHVALTCCMIVVCAILSDDVNDK